MKAKFFCLLAMFFAFAVCSFGVPKIPEKKPLKFKIEKSEAKTILETQKNRGIIFDDGGGGICEAVLIEKTNTQIIQPASNSNRENPNANQYAPYGLDYRNINIRQLLHPPLVSINHRE